MKKIKFLVFILLLLLPISIIKADTVDLYLFYGDGCPHCAEEEEFLDEYLKDKDDVVLNKYEVWHNTDNQEIESVSINKTQLTVTILFVIFWIYTYKL